MITRDFDLRKEYTKRGLEYDEQGPNIFGIRWEENQKESKFNDILGMTLEEGKVLMAKGTTDPSWAYTLSPMNSLGCAHVCLGYHRAIWQVGTHSKGKRSEHQALVQTGNTIKIWRDSNKDGLFNGKEKIYKGYFGINFHGTGKIEGVEDIGPWSAGCQVTKEWKDFSIFMDIIISSNKYKKNKNTTFSYMLFDHKELFDIKDSSEIILGG
jgi:hypothetical protein